MRRRDTGSEAEAAPQVEAMEALPACRQPADLRAFARGSSQGLTCAHALTESAVNL